jgi:hypothetical protein
MPPKAVDPSWLQKRRSLGPSKEDVQCLWAPDPEVRLRLNPPRGYPGSRTLAKNERGGKDGGGRNMHMGGQCDLFASTDPATLLSQYVLDVNSEQIFGRPDAEKAWRDGGDEDFVDEWEDQCLSSLVASLPV